MYEFGWQVYYFYISFVYFSCFSLSSTSPSLLFLVFFFLDIYFLYFWVSLFLFFFSTHFSPFLSYVPFTFITFLIPYLIHLIISFPFSSSPTSIPDSSPYFPLYPHSPSHLSLPFLSFLLTLSSTHLSLLPFSPKIYAAVFTQMQHCNHIKD